MRSPESQRSYRHAIDEFIGWYRSEPRLSFNKIVVTRYRIHLESRLLAPGTINGRLAAVRRLAYEAADASFEMLVRRLQPGYVAPWVVADFTTQVRKNGVSVHAEATVKVEVEGTVYHTAASGNGPVNALDGALRKALSPRFPGLALQHSQW